MKPLPMILALMFSLALVVSCSDSGTDADDSGAADARVTTDAASDGSALESDGAVTPDTLPATIPTVVNCDEDAYETCAAACQGEEGASCSTQCSFTMPSGLTIAGAGLAKYGELNDYGWFDIATAINLADCNESPEKTVDHEWQTYDLVTLLCCCDLPDITVTVVSGDMTNLQSCDAICASRGMTCYPEHDWGSAIPGQPNIGGLESWYTRPSTGGTMYVYGSCEHLVTPSKVLGDFMRELQGYNCACL